MFRHKLGQKRERFWGNYGKAAALGLFSQAERQNGQVSKERKKKRRKRKKGNGKRLRQKAKVVFSISK